MKIFVDPAKTKPWGVAPEGDGPVRFVPEARGPCTPGLLFDAFPDADVYIESLPLVIRDQLVATFGAGHVFYTSTTALSPIRKVAEGVEGGKGRKKSDKADPRMLREHAAEIRWYVAELTEPIAVEAIKLTKSRQLAVALTKLKSLYDKSQSYRDTAFFDSVSEIVRQKEREADKAVERFCRESGLHGYHADLYGVSCVVMVAATSKRPWAFSMNAWRHLNGVTCHAWDPEHAQMRSRGTDGMLKALLHGAVMTLIKKDSPYRPLYDSYWCTKCPTTGRKGEEHDLSGKDGKLHRLVKPGQSGHGSVTIPSSDRALNRVKTKVIEDVKTAITKWYQETQSK